MVKKQFPKIVYFIALSIIMAFLLFNNNGLVKYFRLNSDLDNLRMKIEQANAEIELLDLQIDSLKNSTVKIEKVAREK
ncbi:MAG: septum formation initiator family protein, partial [Melioribacteraceae bacterium]|nr:septum formation initiator family protein [Melioribacteraceae bacterium]